MARSLASLTLLSRKEASARASARPIARSRRDERLRPFTMAPEVALIRALVRSDERQIRSSFVSASLAEGAEGAEGTTRCSFRSNRSIASGRATSSEQAVKGRELIKGRELLSSSAAAVALPSRASTAPPSTAEEGLPLFEAQLPLRPPLRLHPSPASAGAGARPI